MDGYGKRILVIDDDAGCRALLEDQLEQAGYAVQTACDGVAGLVVEIRKRHFDAVIADGHIPGFSGHEFAGFFRIAWPNTPLILLTGDLNSLTDDANESDAAACVRKPYEAAMLLSVLRTVTQPVSTEHAPSPWRR